MHGFKNHLRDRVSVLLPSGGESHQAIQTSSGSNGLQINKIIGTKKKIEEKKQQKSTNNNEVIDVASIGNKDNLYASLDEFKVPMKSEKLQRRYKQMYCEDIKLLKRALKVIYGNLEDSISRFHNNTKVGGVGASTAEVSSIVSCSDTMSNSQFNHSNKTNSELVKDFAIDGHYCHMTKILVMK